MKFVFDIDGIVQTIAIVLTALFTLFAALAAMHSARTSARQLQTSLNREDKINFLGLLDALEKTYDIRFLTRGILYEKLKDFNIYIKSYESYVNSTNDTVKRVFSFDTEIKTGKNFKGEEGESPELFKAYLDYVKDVSLLFEFEFVIPDGSEYVIEYSHGIVIPIYSIDPDKIVYVVDTIAHELLGHKDTKIHEQDLGVNRQRSFEYFEVFRSKYKDQKYLLYQYIENK